jgi:hypothetical protein
MAALNVNLYTLIFILYKDIPALRRSRPHRKTDKHTDTGRKHVRRGPRVPQDNVATRRGLVGLHFSAKLGPVELRSYFRKSTCLLLCLCCVCLFCVAPIRGLLFSVMYNPGSRVILLVGQQKGELFR